MDLKESRGAGAADQGVNELPAILSGSGPRRSRSSPSSAGRRGRAGSAWWPPATSRWPPRAATFAFSEVRIGVVPAVISVTVLPRLLPRAAHELFLTGETFDAARAVADRAGQRRGAGRLARRRGGRYAGMLALGAPGRARGDQGDAAPGPAGATGRPVRRDARPVGPLLRRARRARRASRLRAEAPAVVGAGQPELSSTAQPAQHSGRRAGRR